MERFLISELIKWKESASRKPLILEGARQVGKTWLLKQFGKEYFKSYVYLNCDNSTQLENIFSDYNTKRIIRNLEAVSESKILPGETLIIFDEVQEFPRAITSLKYFCEEAAEYNVAAAGSLLGLLEHKGTGFPVGKVDTLKLYPLSFLEFLSAMNRTILVSQIREHNWEELNVLKPTLTELLRQYYFTGGMPEVVLSYVLEQNLKRVREIQNQIIAGYKNDISKHAPKNDISKITLVLDSIPAQLAKENKKFIYTALKQGGRAKEFENAIQWLINAGIIHKINRIKKLELPVKFYEDFNCFKLYLNDLGLFGAMAGAPASEILVSDNAFTSYKGSFTEQFVAQQFFSSAGENLFYYTNENSTMEIDFVFQTSRVYPVEVKAEENLKSKSLSTVLKNNSALYGVRFSMSSYKMQENMVNVPLALCGEYFTTM